MIDRDSRLALFLTLGRSIERLIQQDTTVVPPQSLAISDALDLAILLPADVRESVRAALVYKLFFVFENFLRDLVLDVLSDKAETNWWSLVPADVRKEVEELERVDETKQWMALASREKLSLTTYPQLLKIILDCWNEGFDQQIRDKGLVQEARLLAHLRNAICHMTDVPDEEVERIKQVLRDWFRIVSP
jgi:Swt1-like HEPN